MTEHDDHASQAVPNPNANLGDYADLSYQIGVTLNALAVEAKKADRAFSGRLRNRNTVRGALEAVRVQLARAEALLAQQDELTDSRIAMLLGPQQ